MKKKRIKKVITSASQKKTKRNVKKRNRKEIKYIPSLIPQLTFIFFLLVTAIGLLTAWPHPQNIAASAPPLPKLLALRTTPSPTPMRKSYPLIAKAMAQEQSDYCIEIPILFYHHVQPLGEAMRLGHAQFTVDDSVFDLQMEYLRNQGYITVSVDTVVDALINKKQLSQKMVAITFDDGYVDMYSYAYPILKQYSFVGNFAIPTGLIDRSDYMTWNQLDEIASDPQMYIYNHTLTHMDLANHSTEAEKEIIEAQNDIQNKLGLRSNIFFYPYGTFNDTVISILKAHGYVAAFSTLPGKLQCESSIMTLRRIRVGNSPLSSYGL